MAILGAPNAGKSTLLNALIGAKISIVTPKVQTTRTRVLGVMNAGNTQVVYIDTPGIFTPKKRLDRAMVAAAWESALDADLTLMLIDAKSGVDSNALRIIDSLKSSKGQTICILNKIDTVERQRLLALTEQLAREHVFMEFYMISALKGDGVDDLKTAITGHVPKGPWHFPEDQLCDMSDRLFAAEITREKLYLNLHQELPYALTVETETWEAFENGAVRIDQIIFVERKSQKGIVLGKGGERIKRIRTLAQEELKEIFEREVHLFLFVKVRENWGDDPERYQDLGLDFSA